MRIGLVGTGPWARIAHGPGLAAADDVELAGVWGRRPEPARLLAEGLGTRAYPDYAALLDDVEAVAFSVPPEVQSTLAVQAARAGRHLLLDKPVARTPSAARELAAAVEAHGVASVVFLTDRFSPEFRAWLDDVRREPGWRGASTRWLTTLDSPGNPFRDSPWRQADGALWDIGPHVLSTLWAALGEVTAVRAVPGIADTVSLLLTHEGGASSTAVMSLFAPPAAVVRETVLWGEAGTTTMPGRSPESEPELVARAASELAESARTGVPHPLGVALGARIVELLDEAETQLAAATPEGRGGGQSG